MTTPPPLLFQGAWPDGEYRFFQMGFVVDNVIEQAARWAHTFGVGPFHVLPPIEQPCTYRGHDSGFNTQVSVAQAGPVQIELIEQRCDRASVYREQPAGFHQLCTVTRDYDGTRARYRALGYAEACDLTAADGLRVAYIDTFRDFGFYTEVVEHSPVFLEQLSVIARTCATWDGSDPVRILTRSGYRVP
jgi:hypothetical protein